MAHKRLIVYAILVAVCYLVGVTWADSAASGLQNNSSSQVAGGTNGPAQTANVKQVTTIPSSPAPAAPKLHSTVASVLALVTNGTKTSSSSSGSSIPAAECVCDGALLPRLSDNGKELEICPECKCKQVARNTTLIKVVVIIVIWIISILVIYMLFLMCLDPLLNKRVKANYQEHTNEDDDATSSTPPLPTNGNQELNARANVLNRVGHQQDKWKRQVREQRRHIYDRHTMLN